MWIRSACALFLSLLFLIPDPAGAVEERRVQVYGGNKDLDGPSGAPLSQSSRPHDGPSKLPPTILASYDFGSGACDPQGWVSIDEKNLAGFIFHFDNNGFTGNLTGGTSGRLVPLSGVGSLWCGLPLLPLDTNFCGYATAPGYGNNWNETFESIAMTRPPGVDVQLDYMIAYDTETGYDLIYVEYKDVLGDWIKLTLPSTGTDHYTGLGWPAFTEVITIPDASLPPTTVQLRFRFTSDGGWSDQDGLFNTDGAVLLDDIQVKSGATTLNFQDFEVGAVYQGNTFDNVWLAKAVGRGDFAKVALGSSTLQQSPPLPASSVNPTCLWTFFDGSPDSYACGGFPAESVVPFGSTNEGYVDNAIWSPWIPWEPLPGQTTHISFDVYRDLPIDNLVFYEVAVRTRVAFNCPEQWVGNSFVYYGGIEWLTQDVDMSAYVSTTPGADEIQFSLSVIDLSVPFATLGSGACHSNAPLFDNIEIYIDNTHSWVVHDLDLWQDTFPGDGTATGTIRADAASGDDVVRFRVTEPGIGIDTEGNGPAVFVHVKNLPGKSGAIVSGGPDWPEVPSLGDAEWTVIQCGLGTEPNEYVIDLNDGLYTGGDVVYFYFSARDANGGTTYYSQFTGRVDTEGEARAYPMEFTGLPDRAQDGQTTVLYIDYFSSRGAEPFFNTSFDEMGMAVDRYDVRAPSSFAGNGPGDRVINVGNQMFPFYDTIIWNTGDLEDIPMSDNDWLLLAVFADFYTGPQVGLYLSGDNLPTALANSQSPGATYLLANFCNFSMISSDHRAMGEPVSPMVIPENGSPFTREMIAYGGGAGLGRFDVMQPGQTALAGMTYSGNGQLPAVIGQQSQASNGATVNVILSGFSHHKIRDDKPEGTQDRTEHLFDILQNVSGAGNPPVAVGDEVPTSARLDQNVPNPFNPSTRIQYAIKSQGHVKLVVYNVAGERVATLIDDVQTPRPEGFTAVWEGKSDSGAQVASGVYFYKLTTPGFTQTRKMVLLK